MRLFIGIPLEPAVVEQLARLVARLQRPADGLRWSRPETWHITLQFLGETSAEQLACTASKLRTLSPAPFSIQIEGLGFFDRAGVFFAGVRLNPELVALQRSVVAATSGCGFPQDDRPYHPHITLARTKGHGASMRDLKPRVGRVPPFSSSATREFLLYESFLGPGGSRYEIRERFPLSALNTVRPAFLAGHELRILEAALPDWLPRQRWFGAKTRQIQNVNLLEWVDFPAANSGVVPSPDLSTTSQPPSALCYLAVHYSQQDSDVYQVPLALSNGVDAEQIRAAHSAGIIATLDTPEGTAILHDATLREDFRQILLTLVGQNAKLPLSPNPAVQPTALPSGVLTAQSSAAFAATVGGLSLPARVGSVEQSNTSILYGNQLILKLFRRLQTGENPDVETSRFLTEIAHFAHIPPYLGEIAIVRSTGEKTTVAMLQGLVANQGDGWKWFHDQLVAFFGQVADIPAPVDPTTPDSFATNENSPTLPPQAEPALNAAALLGRLTAELHLALASSSADPAFRSEPFTSEDLKLDALRIRNQVITALDALQAKLPVLPPAIAAEAAALLSRRGDFLSRASDLATAQPEGLRIRIHGDYHLGQTLLTADPPNGDFVLLDFEGEPSRPLAERRRKQSPLKDVAGMIRSISYVTHSALAQFLAQSANSRVQPGLSAWASQWESPASAAFLKAYGESIAVTPALLPSPERAQALLSAYVLEKALYELLYELNHRPDWLHIPIGALLAM